MNTNNWKIDLFTALDSAHSLSSVIEVSLAAVKPFGFDFCGWRTLPSRPDKSTVALNSIEDEVTKTMLKGGYDRAPVPSHCAHSMDPIAWQGTFEDGVFLQCQELIEEYYGFGHRAGWAIATLDKGGSRGMFFVESKNAFSPEELYYAEQHMRWVSSAAYMRISEVKENTCITLSQYEKKLLAALAHHGENVIKASEQCKIPLAVFLADVEKLKKQWECQNIYELVSRAMLLGLVGNSF